MDISDYMMDELFENKLCSFDITYSCFDTMRNNWSFLQFLWWNSMRFQANLLIDIIGFWWQLMVYWKNVFLMSFFWVPKIWNSIFMGPMVNFFFLFLFWESRAFFFPSTKCYILTTILCACKIIPVKFLSCRFDSLWLI